MSLDAFQSWLGSGSAPAWVQAVGSVLSLAAIFVALVVQHALDTNRAVAGEQRALARRVAGIIALVESIRRDHLVRMLLLDSAERGEVDLRAWVRASRKAYDVRLTILRTADIAAVCSPPALDYFAGLLSDVLDELASCEMFDVWLKNADTHPALEPQTRNQIVDMARKSSEIFKQRIDMLLDALRSEV